MVVSDEDVFARSERFKNRIWRLMPIRLLWRDTMQLQKCSIQDAGKLALFNKQLIEDEKSDNPMDLMDLERRMKEFLETEYNAYFFIENSQIIGYAQAFHMLLEYLGIKEIELDVLPWNKRGLAFGKQCGFSETCIAMKYKEQRGINCTK